MFKQLWCVIFILVLGCKNSGDTKAPLQIAAASNLQFVINELIVDYQRQTGDSVRLVTGSSGKLSAQITQGAPFDLLMSANLAYPEYLFNNKLTANPPKIYAFGQLVLWTTTAQLKPSMELLRSTQTTKVALANPELAPYGRAAMECLKYYKLDSLLTPKLVYGESIAQTNQFITTGATELGFTALSVVINNELVTDSSFIILPKTCYSPIEQAVVVLKNGKNQAAALKFYDYLSGDSAGEILKKFGYSLPE